jgi:two-component system, NtrC family, sensor histidine kinase KinB
MKTSIRNTRFTLGIVLFLFIILLLSVLSGFYLNRLSKKTSAILKENHYSVVYARNMAEELTNINQAIINCFLTNKNPDTSTINREFKSFDESLQLEKNNITEVGEDVLAMRIEFGFTDYRDLAERLLKSKKSVADVSILQMKFGDLYKQFMLLSQVNEKAIEIKTNDAQISAKKATLEMSFIGALCFLIAYGFTFSFTSYFHDRFYKLYVGIHEMVSSNYSQRLYFDGKDEFYEISLIFNEMAEKLDENCQKKSNFTERF